MNTAIACVGKLKEAFWRDGTEEYIKRLARFGRCEILEVPDLPVPENASPATEAQIMEKEGEKLLSRVREQDYVIAMCIGGKRYDSVAFSRHLGSLADRGEKRLVFVIGGSLGLGSNVLARADERLSLSDMTMPHNLARLFLLEQLYRAEKIRAGEKYHK